LAKRAVLVTGASRGIGRAVAQAFAELGGLDVLVNNAGIYLWHPITEVSYEQWQDAWRQTLAVNLTGAANVTWCAVQHMKEAGGRIVNMSSRGAFRGEPRHPAYGASKAGLNGFGQSMARAPGAAGYLSRHGGAGIRRDGDGRG
jgi:3-oxoacyl-[acyl-carrier protein] reductase